MSRIHNDLARFIKFFERASILSLPFGEAI
jgi:hypothetical protein